MLLIVAAAISGLLGEWIDAAAILAIVVLNATLGVIQERRAEEALAALKKLAAPEAQVLRDGIAADRARPGAGPRATSFSSRPATSSRPICACWRRSTCAWKKPP